MASDDTILGPPPPGGWSQCGSLWALGAASVVALAAAATGPARAGSSARIIKATKQGGYYHLRIRSPDRFDQIRTPDWAARAASGVVDGAEVRMGRTPRGAWLVQSVLIPRASGRSMRDARHAAEAIVHRIER